jgi:hypothetical protein
MCRFKPLSDPRQQLLQMMTLESGQSDETRSWRFPNRLIHIQINYMNFIEMIDFLQQLRHVRAALNRLAGRMGKRRCG